MGELATHQKYFPSVCTSVDMLWMWLLKTRMIEIMLVHSKAITLYGKSRCCEDGIAAKENKASN